MIFEIIELAIISNWKGNVISILLFFMVIKGYMLMKMTVQ